MRVAGFRSSGFCVVAVSIGAALALNACGSSTTAPTSGLTAPTLASPLDDAIAPEPPVLTVNNARPDRAGALTYDFQVADSSAALTSGQPAGLLASATGVAEGADGRTAYTLEGELQRGKRYYWRSKAVQAGTAGPWSSIFRFRTDYAPNQPPIIHSLNPSSARAEVNAEITLNAVVTDQESDPAGFTYSWTATGGTFTGTGPSVRWRAPVGGTPTSYALTLTVIERYTVTDPDGKAEARENQISASATVHVNDSPTEVTDLVLTFLDDFSHSDRSPEFCVRNFSDNCPGKAEELGDITSNRENFTIIGRSFSVKSVTFNKPVDATAADVVAPCRFVSIRKSTGMTEVAEGNCLLKAVYEEWKWFLCESRLQPSATSSPTWFPFRRPE